MLENMADSSENHQFLRSIYLWECFWPGLMWLFPSSSSWTDVFLPALYFLFWFSSFWYLWKPPGPIIRCPRSLEHTTIHHHTLVTRKTIHFFKETKKYTGRNDMMLDADYIFSHKYMKTNHVTHQEPHCPRLIWPYEFWKSIGRQKLEDFNAMFVLRHISLNLINKNQKRKKKKKPQKMETTAE